MKESNADVNLESDALFVKNCCAIVHCHRRLITELLQSQQLLMKAAKMYRSVSENLPSHPKFLFQYYKLK